MTKREKGNDRMARTWKQIVSVLSLGTITSATRWGSSELMVRTGEPTDWKLNSSRRLPNDVTPWGGERDKGGVGSNGPPSVRTCQNGSFRMDKILTPRNYTHSRRWRHFAWSSLVASGQTFKVISRTQCTAQTEIPALMLCTQKNGN